MTPQYVEAGEHLAKITVELSPDEWADEGEEPKVRIWQWDEYNTIVLERARISELVAALKGLEEGGGDE